MLRRLLPVLVAVTMAAIPLGAGGCSRAGGAGPAFPQPIRDEKEPGESVDTLSAVPDTGSSSVDELSGGSSETEIEIDEDSSSSDGDGDGAKEGEKSADADKSGDESGDGAGGDDEGGEDETGDEPDEPGDGDGDAGGLIRP